MTENIIIDKFYGCPTVSVISPPKQWSLRARGWPACPQLSPHLPPSEVVLGTTRSRIWSQESVRVAGRDGRIRVARDVPKNNSTPSSITLPGVISTAGARLHFSESLLLATAKQPPPGSESIIAYIYIYVSQQVQEHPAGCMHCTEESWWLPLLPEILLYLKLTQKNPSSTSGAAASPSQSSVCRVEGFWGTPA